MKKHQIALLLAFAIVFILGCQLVPGSPSVEAPPQQQPVEQPAEQPAEQQEEPAPPTQAPTNTPIPQPTSPPIPQSGDIIFQTDFSSISGWDIIASNDESGYPTEIRGDGLYVEVPDENDYWYAYAPMDYYYEDVRIEADVELVGGTNYTYITLVCRSSDAGEYIFYMDTGGYWQIGKYIFGDDTSYEQLGYGGSTRIKVAKHPNHITAICKGNTLTMFVNGHEVGTVEDSHFTEGVVGIGIETFDFPLSQVMFHNLEVYIP